MFFTLFNRSKVIPVGGGSETVQEPTTPVIPTQPEPKQLRVLAASETKYRPTNKKTLFLEVIAIGCQPPFSYSIFRGTSKVADFNTSSVNVAYEHALTPGDYSVKVSDSAGVVSAEKTFSVQPEEADLTLMSIEQHGSLFLLIDAGRGDLGPFKINVWDDRGNWVTSLDGNNPNPIRVNHNLPNGTYYFQIVDKYGFWSNIKPFTVVGGQSVSVGVGGGGGAIDIGFEFPDSGGILDPIGGDRTLPDSGDLEPHEIQTGRKDDLNIVVTDTSEGHFLTDISTKSLPDDRLWVYYIGNDRIVSDKNLKNYPVEHNNPLQVAKMGIKKGQETFKNWKPGADNSGYFKSDTGMFFDHGDIGSCVTIIFQ